MSCLLRNRATKLFIIFFVTSLVVRLLNYPFQTERSSRMKRIQGFVIGRDHVRGILTWKVRVQETQHSLNGKKLKVASATAELANGLNVDFLIGTRHNETVAIDVAPRGVKEQEKGKIMKRLFIIAIALMALMGAVLTAIIIFLPTTIPDLKRRLDSAIMIHRANEVVANLRMATFGQLVPDSIIRQTIGRANDRRWVSWNANTFARHAVFRDRLLGVFDDNEKLYWDGLYAAYSGGEGYFQHYGLPVELDQPLKEVRRLIMETAREYLRDPNNLEAFYQAKKPIILDEVAKLSPKNQMKIRQWLGDAITAFRRFSKEDLKKYQARRQAEEGWLESSRQALKASRAFEEAGNQLMAMLPLDSLLAKQVKERSGWYHQVDDRPVMKRITVAEVPTNAIELFARYRVAEKNWADAEMHNAQMYRLFSQQGEKLWENTPDEYATLFAGRRFNEGGQSLVDAYIRIADDLLANLNAK